MPRMRRNRSGTMSDTRLMGLIDALLATELTDGP